MCTVSLQTKETTYVFPLYLYPETTNQTTTDASINSATAARTPNLNIEIVNKIAEKIGLQFVAERHCDPPAGGEAIPKDGFVPRHDDEKVFTPTDILDYIYAVLHSPSYREKYKEFLKIDFPRVPFPKDLEGFRNLQGLGAQLRQIHLLESDVTEKYITQYPVSGNNVVSKIKFEPNDIANEPNVIAIRQLAEKQSQNKTASFLAVTGSVYINETQYFANVPTVAWNFYIGGYQPAQKWLKDRKGRTLEFEDILHYQKIIVALAETDRLMQQIDKIEIE